jgi:hypothetical protein
MVCPIDAQQAYAWHCEASGVRRGQSSREEVQQAFQASAARTKSPSSRTHFRNSASPRERRLVQRLAQWKVGRLHRSGNEEVPDCARTESQRQTRRANPAKTRPRLTNRRSSSTNAANSHILNSNQGRPDGPAPVVSSLIHISRVERRSTPNLICIPSKTELER